MKSGIPTIRSNVSEPDFVIIERTTTYAHIDLWMMDEEGVYDVMYVLYHCDKRKCLA